MNFLAHAYLSFGDAGILTGNMISDFVKGKKQYDYPLTVQQGIRLHRDIDAFTDAHEATRFINQFFKPAYRLYAGAFTDIVYDYFLANDKAVFSSQADLASFAQKTYALLDDQTAWFGEGFSRLYPYMKSQDWLYNSQSETHIRNSFEGLRRRSAYITESQTAFNIFLQKKSDMQPAYERFFPDIKKYALDRFNQL